MITEMARVAGFVKGVPIINRNNQKSRPIIKKKKITIVRRSSYDL